MIVRHRSITPAGLEARALDRTFEQITSSLFAPVRRGPEVTASWEGDSLVLTVDLPGVAPEQVAVETAGRHLTLSAETDTMRWTRSVQIGDSLDLDKIEAHHVNGRLSVRIAPVEAPATRSIPVATTPLPRAAAPGRVEIPAVGESELQDSQSTATSSGADH